MPPNPSCGCSGHLCPLFCVSSSGLLRDPGLDHYPKLYANTIYMVLNSRIRIMGGRDTYTSSTDMEITTTMMRDITSHSTQGARQTPTVVISKEVSSSDDEMGRMSVSYFDSCTLLGLIFYQGETTRQRYEPPRVTVRVHPLSPVRPTIYGLVGIHTDTNLLCLCAKVFRSLYTYSYLKSWFTRLLF